MSAKRDDGLTKLSYDGFTKRRYLRSVGAPNRMYFSADLLFQHSINTSASLAHITTKPTRKHEIRVALDKNLNCTYDEYTYVAANRGYTFMSYNLRRAGSCRAIIPSANRDKISFPFSTFTTYLLSQRLRRDTSSLSTVDAP